MTLEKRMMEIYLGHETCGPQEMNECIEYSIKYGIKDWLSAAGREYARRQELKRKANLYLLTLTLKKDIKDTEELRQKVCKWIEDLKDREGLRLTKLEYVMELTEQGRPHYHIILETTELLRKRHFEQARKRFGNFDLSKSKTNKYGHLENYLLKDNEEMCKII